MNEKIEIIKKNLPANTPFLNQITIENLLADNEITEDEARELLNWNFGMEIDWTF